MTTATTLTPEEEIAILRDALDHIARTARSSRTGTRRLSFIEERAKLALKYRPYNRDDFELPGVRTAEAMAREKLYAKRYRKLRSRNLLECDFDIIDLSGKFDEEMDAFVDALPPLPPAKKQIKDDEGVAHTLVEVEP